MQNRKGTIYIALASNNNYAVLMAALIKSIIHNHHSDESLVFFLLNDQISKTNQAKVNALVQNSPEVSLKWFDANQVFPKNVKFPEDGSAFPSTAYLRLFAPHIALTETKRLIYFDVDMIVRKDVSEIWNMDLQGFTMAAVLDVTKTVGCTWGGIPNYKELGLPADAKYFNSGLMVIDCEKWVAQNIPEQQSYTGKESQRRGYMLFGIKPVKDIRRFVQNRGSCEGDHYEREDSSQRKAEDRTRHDES